MVTILPVRDLETLGELNRKYDASARFACRLFEGGEVTGVILYDIDFVDHAGVLRRVDASGDEAVDGLCRAAFSILADAGIDAAQVDAAVDAAPLERLGFLKPGERKTGSLRTILQGCSHCIRH